MSWQEQNAIKRIFNAFKRTKKQIYNEDIQALELINESFNEYKKAYVNDNLLFAKLLCVILKQNVSYYQDIQSSIKKINDDLKQPLNYHLQFLKMELNNIQINDYLKSINVDTNFFSNKDNSGVIKANEKEIIEAINKSWDLNSVEKSFYNTANTFLKDVNNYQ
jgi:hypothetical protein